MNLKGPLMLHVRIAPVPVPAIAAMLLLFAVLPLPAQRVERITLPGEDVAIYNLAGDVRVEPGPGPAVVVDLVREGRDGARLRVARDEIEGRWTLRVVPTGRQIAYPGYRGQSALDVCENGTFGSRCRGGRRVRIANPGTDARATLRVQVPSGKRIHLHSGVGSITLRSLGSEVVVTSLLADVIADRTRGPIQITTGAGDVELNGAAGVAEVETVVGKVRVAAFRGGRLALTTGAGEVLARGVVAEELSIRTLAGGVEAVEVRAPVIRINAAGGEVRLARFSGIRSMEVVSGKDVTVEVPPTLDAVFRVRSATGAIRVEVPMQSVERSGSRFFGRMGAGTGRIQINAASGTVRLLSRR